MANEANYNATNHLTHEPSPPVEKDFNDYNNHIGGDVDSETALQRIRTAGSISISPELFEKIYLSPQNKVAGELRKTFGNPTPLALCGFLLSLTPLSCMLMGWRGASATGAADIGAYFFFGGLLMWLIGNTFPFVVFGSFGAFWLTFAATLQPFYDAYGAFSPNINNPAEGLQTVEFNASFGFFLVFMGLLCLVYFICSLRTNVVFAMIFCTLVAAFGCLAGAYWHLALAYGAAANSTAQASHAATASRLMVAGGAITFVTDMCGWWIFFAIMLAALDFPFQLPVGDLSTFIKGASDRRKAKEEKERYSA
ncbi:GPR1/FUN34/YaaH-class plasma membrane protein-like protein, partial [Aureobasidium melanogenum]